MSSRAGRRSASSTDSGVYESTARGHEERMYIGGGILTLILLIIIVVLLF